MEFEIKIGWFYNHNSYGARLLSRTVFEQVLLDFLNNSFFRLIYIYIYIYLLTGQGWLDKKTEIILHPTDY